MKSDNNYQASTDADGFCGNDGSSELPPPLHIGRNIHPGVSVPPTILVTELDNGALVLQGRPDGPRVRLSSADAIPLRRELAAAFVLGDVRCAVDQEHRSD